MRHLKARPKTGRIAGAPSRCCPDTGAPRTAPVRVLKQHSGRIGGRWPGVLDTRQVLIPALHCGRGDGPCHWSGEGPVVSSGGNRKRTAFPRPRGTVPR